MVFSVLKLIINVLKKGKIDGTKLNKIFVEFTNVVSFISWFKVNSNNKLF